MNSTTGPLQLYFMDDELCPVDVKPVLERSLDPDAARAAADAVAKQAG